MIVKILSTIGNFESVDYNEHKHDTGKGKLMVASNFDGLLAVIDRPVKSDYIAYLKTTAATNSRVTNKEFHAVISAKGREHTYEQLLDIAIQYLVKMGYGRNPYLIYQHSDTENNHVHIVSTRVDKDGNKIDDSFERVRSQKALQDIIQINPANEAMAAFENAINYSFSTLPQFKLLLELKGFKITQEGEAINLYKYGILQGSYNIDLVRKKIKDYSVDKARSIQLKAIFNKYKIGTPTPQFVRDMNSKFGIELIFHQKGNFEKPYGYTIIDHKSRSVYKGSEVLRLNVLLSTLTSRERKEGALIFLESIQKRPIPFNEVRRELKNYGYDLQYNGTAVLDGDEKFNMEIDLELLRKIKYIQRIGEASQYKISSNSDQEVLSKLFFIKKDELSNAFITQEQIDDYRSLLSSIDQSNEIDEGIKEGGWLIARIGKDFFLVDKENRVVVEMNQIDERKFDFFNFEHIDLGESWNYRQIEKTHDYIGFDLTRSLLDLFTAIGEPMENNRKRKESRKQKRY